MLGRKFKILKLLGVGLILMALSATVACGGSAAPTASDSGAAKDSSVSEPKSIPTSVPKSADAEPASEGGDMVISVSSYLGFQGVDTNISEDSATKIYYDEVQLNGEYRRTS